MCAKKKAAFNKTWKLAGEPIYSCPLTVAEREDISEDFFIYKKFRGGGTRGLQCVTPAMAKVQESAAQAAAGFLCQHYAGRFERNAVIKTVSVMTAIPGDMIYRAVSGLDFLMGAALWLLDYLEDACEAPDEYLDLLPKANEALDLYMPCAEDLIHSQETILRMVTLLEDREKSYRKQFRALLNLIDDETAAKLRGSFKAAILDYLDRAIEIYNRLKPVAPELPVTMEDFTQPFDPLRMVDRRTENPEIYFLMLASELVCRPLSEIQEELHSRKAAELLAGYGVDDPHDLCAAYLLLEREGDALTNLNALTAVVLNCAARHLPWAQDDFGARAGLFQSGAPDYRLRYEYSDLPDENGEEPLEMDWRLSETQLFFLATGVILPRGRAPSDKLVRWFMRQGVEKQRARELAWAAFIAYYVDNGDYSWRSLDLFDEEEDEDLPEDEPMESCEEPEIQPTEAPADARIEALTRQVKELRSALHDAERTSNRLREQLQDLEQRGEAERSELTQLRDTLYQLRAGEDEASSDSGPLVELPWQVRQRVVVFGGHDSWRKAVKPLLPGARFYDREVLPDLNTIRGADAVWLQVNALSHKYYYRIIDAARKNDIPVRYFGSASAKKCAVQLALDELAAGKRAEV